MLVTAEGARHFEHDRIDTTSTHGTGCTLSAAITAGLALGHPLEKAVSDGAQSLDFENFERLTGELARVMEAIAGQPA